MKVSAAIVARVSHDAETWARVRATYLRVGAIGGAVIGLGLALGTWGPDVAAQLDTPLQGNLLVAVVGSALLVLLGALAGYASARIDRALAGLLIWLAAAILVFLVISRAPYNGRTWLVGLSDSRFAGLPLYPYDGFGHGRAAFFIVLLFAFLGVTHVIRLEALRGSLGAKDRLSAQTVTLLLVHLAAAFGVGLVADSAVNAPLRVAPQLVHEAIRTGRTYQGDLFALSRERQLNYNAISGVRNQMSANYTLQIGESDLVESLTVIVVAHFDNGAWINCRVLADQLSFCYDASPPYTQGLRALITGEPLGDCTACAVRANTDLREWLRARNERFAGSPRISRLAQYGSYVRMRAESPGGDYAIECRFHGIQLTTLETCAEAP